MKKIAVLTGSRSEYGILKSVMKSIRDHSDLELITVVTGMHLLEDFGHTIDNIKSDGFNIDHVVEMDHNIDSGFGMAKNIGTGIIGVSKILQKSLPDVLVVLGDRTEALAGTIAAAYMNVVIAHIHGGDTSKGGVDESTRHAITKFAHIHFPATKKSAQRIRKMGEKQNRIHVVGAPGLDLIVHENLIPKKDLIHKYGLPEDGRYIILLQHPVTTLSDKPTKLIKETLEAIKRLNIRTIAIYPNSDVGGKAMIEVIERYRSDPNIDIYKSIPHRDYLSLLKYCACLVGNSSSGIIESPIFRIPVVNIGQRQIGRERSSNIIDVDYDRESISKAVKKAIYEENFNKKVKSCNNPYGDGNSGKKIAEILSRIRLTDDLIQKKITY